ncbi:DUF5825 family protein [Actinomadura sp. HBU206391]|uniref:DUF5825 family protein n=1 Tax=Actinomadura sp. HBU206391 TaxID=2731692 RepID=UPI00164EE06D|nr:DUF5825 family protein [Actinomadura sp. HBU206391]MBC6462654.1 hypothetical protein [Actinomadura sp. HBU206391]
MIAAIPPGATVEAPHPIILGENPVDTVRFVSWLRDRFSDGVIVRWQGSVVSTFAPPDLYHLPPPEGTGGWYQEWRDTFALGLFYFRRGPGFIQIKDVRDPAASASFVLDEGPLTRTFTRCLVPCSLAELQGDEREAAEALLEENLLLRAGDLVVTLPNRMKRWPVPAMAL